ncbi:MAG: hypothetical protein V3T23_09390, partial [Nitrososphaerales archaeon]
NRNLVQTIERIKKLTPKLWPRANLFLQKMVMVQISSTKRGPDYDPMFWKRTADFLSEFLDPVDCDWKRQILIEFLGPEASKRKGLYGLDKKDPGHGFKALTEGFAKPTTGMKDEDIDDPNK